MSLNLLRDFTYLPAKFCHFKGIVPADLVGWVAIVKCMLHVCGVLVQIQARSNKLYTDKVPDLVTVGCWALISNIFRDE